MNGTKCEAAAKAAEDHWAGPRGIGGVHVPGQGPHRLLGVLSRARGKG